MWLFLKIKTGKKERNTTTAAKNSILHTLGLSKKSQIEVKLLFLSNFCGSSLLGGEGNCGSSDDVNHSLHVTQDFSLYFISLTFVVIITYFIPTE
jgi:hypothetical protein